MKNIEADIQNQDSLQKQPSRQRWYKIAALLIFLFIIWILSYDFFQPDRVKISSYYIIRAEAARHLNKNVDDLTDKDLQRITKFTLVDRTQKGYYIYGLKLSDIKLLRKFRNLRELDLSYVRPVQGDVPVRKKFLAKLHVVTIPKIPLLDLKPLRGLTSLKVLDLSNTEIYSLEPLKKMKNLRKITLRYSNVSDLRPLKELTNLEELYITESADIKKEQIEDLQKALPELEINDNVFDVGSMYF